ncbi:MAG: hypothetical protein HQM11_17920 [SAR324 cluster bacterium]|nr:hypothetical protein [SAR324 cluster bacterium]
MLSKVILCVLIVALLANFTWWSWKNHTLPSSIQRTIAIQRLSPQQRLLCSVLHSSMNRARKYFLYSVKQSYLDVNNTTPPIQVDLYILVHFLMYQDVIKFTGDSGEELFLRKKIMDYFSSTFGQDIWEREGCVLVKLLTGMEKSYAPFRQMKPMMDYYAKFIHSHWKNDGVGECFSGNIRRSYGPLNLVPECSPVTNELDAKLAYFKSITRFSRHNPLMNIQSPSLELEPSGAMIGWADILPEMYVIRGWQEQKNGVIKQERYEIARKRVVQAVNKLNVTRVIKTGLNMDILLYAYLRANRKVDIPSSQMLKKLLSVQKQNGSFPSPFDFGPTHPNKKHNIDASPTYFALLAMNEYSNLMECPE